MGSNQININGQKVSETHWQSYSPDGDKMNLNFYKNGENVKIRNLDLKDFSNILRNSISNDPDEFEDIKKMLNSNNSEFHSILNTCKSRKPKKETLKKKNKMNKKKKGSRKKKN